jgi:IS605 OrfB family transposase
LESGKNGVFLNVQCKLPNVPRTTGNSVLGIDRGIMNIVACSDNSFVNSRHLRAVKGRYQYLKAKLQSIGTASARRKLKKLSGAERRFTLDVNHVIAKKLVQKPYDVFAVETLRVGSGRSRGRKLNRMLGGWSYGELLTLLTYKAESSGKRVVQVNPSYTSQRCSKLSVNQPIVAHNGTAATNHSLSRLGS